MWSCSWEDLLYVWLCLKAFRHQPLYIHPWCVHHPFLILSRTKERIPYLYFLLKIPQRHFLPLGSILLPVLISSNFTFGITLQVIKPPFKTSWIILFFSLVLLFHFWDSVLYFGWYSFKIQKSILGFQKHLLEMILDCCPFLGMILVSLFFFVCFHIVCVYIWIMEWTPDWNKY